jgi:hypothetical protein
VNIVKAKAAVEFLGKQLAQAMDAADSAAVRVEEARAEALASVQRHHTALLEVERLHNEFLAAEAEFAACQTELSSMNGQAGGAAFNATIRTDPNPETT